MSALTLRARLRLGAVLWTLGLFIALSILITQVMFRHPSTPRFFHHVFSYTATGSVVAAVCLLLGVWHVRRGVSAIAQLRARLAAVHGGRDQRVGGRYPGEVQPLVDDLNALLEHREQAVRRALAKAGDLAHGLKTPLAVLRQEAERAAAAGHEELAAAIGQQVDRMRRQVDYHLAHARAAASGGQAGTARTVVAAAADGLARTLRQLHAGRDITIAVAVDAGHVVRAERADLDELLGNLLDNACKWARTAVIVSSAVADGTCTITVDDDGPGLAPALREAVLQRGVRADEAAPGSGLGLAIVRDLAELYGGTIALTESPQGGVRARLQLPAA
jgi:signal transduction histidine kinase